MVVFCHLVWGMLYHVQKFLIRQEQLEQMGTVGKEADQLGKKEKSWIFFDCLS